MAPRLTEAAGEAYGHLSAALTRVERVTWGTEYGPPSYRTLGELRRLLRELADWPDDAAIQGGTLTAYRELPLHTEADT